MPSKSARLVFADWMSVWRLGLPLLLLLEWRLLLVVLLLLWKEAAAAVEERADFFFFLKTGTPRDTDCELH